jgi:thymidylate synthase
MQFKFRNVNDAFLGLITGFANGSIPTSRRRSRVGKVMVVDEPVMVTYTYPRERVLFNAARDANPFFHLFESLWMLAGRNDVEPLAHYNSQMVNYSDNGETFNGAYGYRWCRHGRTMTEACSRWFNNNFNALKSVGDCSWKCPVCGGCGYAPNTTYPDPMCYGCGGSGVLNPSEHDQLSLIIDQLKRKPGSRRCVLQMWNVEDDLLKIDVTKEVCCNTHAYFSLRDEGIGSGPVRLDMTVCNRSNDMIWGMLGANVVHFSFLQEYIANCLGVGVGVYNQFSNNLHVYTERWEPEKWLANTMVFDYANCNTVPLVKNQTVFDQECAAFIDSWLGNWTEPFLARVAAPMCRAFNLHKYRRYAEALAVVSQVESDDWQVAAFNWISKRKQLWENKNVSSCVE